AGLEHREQFLVRQADAGCIARRLVAVERELRPMRNDRLPIGERADPQLRALEVAQYGDRAVEFLLQRADRADGLRVGFVVAMAEIDPEGIGARAKQA